MSGRVFFVCFSSVEIFILEHVLAHAIGPYEDLGSDVEEEGV